MPGQAGETALEVVPKARVFRQAAVICATNPKVAFAFAVLFPQAMEMCLHMLSAFVDAHGDGDEGAEIEAEDHTLRRLKQPHDKRYLSIFGELIIPRVVYGTREGQAIK